MTGDLREIERHTEAAAERRGGTMGVPNEADTALPELVPPAPDFPTKYISAGALFLDEQGRLLLVKPTYKDGWEIPGGIVEADESPVEACRREIREELGLELAPGRLLVVDYTSRRPNQSDALQLVFLGGALDAAAISAIRLPADELSEYRFVPPGKAVHLLPTTLARRVASALLAISDNRTLMLHDGIEV
ncbi:MAG: NUDIX hydrolase [Chloroflexota bacterium]